MRHRTTLSYTPALVRQSVWVFWKRSLFTTLPLNDLPKTMQTETLERVLQHGGTKR